MGKEEFAKVLEGIVNDADMAERVAAGDFGAGDLTEAEEALLSAAAGDLDGDVTGFTKHDTAKMVSDVAMWESFSPNVQLAFGYLKIGDIKGEG